MNPLNFMYECEKNGLYCRTTVPTNIGCMPVCLVIHSVRGTSRVTTARWYDPWV